jgi:outer membrane protein TolC
MKVNCILVLLLARTAFSQLALDYFIDSADRNSPALKEYYNLQSTSKLEYKLNRAENAAFQVSLTGNYLFVPYFNNKGGLVTTNPSPQAYGYDINLFDGGLYSAQINVERNLFNGNLLNTLDTHTRVQSDIYQYSAFLERHNIKKQVTDQYLSALQSLRLTHLTNQIVANLEQQQKLLAEMVEKGFVNSRDYLLLQIEIKGQRMDLQKQQQEYKSNLLQLYAMCGIQDTSLVDLEPVALTVSGPAAGSHFTEKYNLDSLMVVNDQALFDSKYQPQLQAFFNTGLNAVELENISHRFGMSAGLNLSLALFDGNQRNIVRQQNLLSRRTISEHKQYSELEISTQRKNSLARLRTLENNMTNLGEQIQDYNKVLQISANQLQHGNISMIDYLTLLRNSIELQKNQIETEISYQQEVNNYEYWNW